MNKINAMLALCLMVGASAVAADPGVPVPMKDARVLVSAPAVLSSPRPAEDVALAVSRDAGLFKLSASMRVGLDFVSLTSEGKIEAVGAPMDGAKGVARIHGKNYAATVHVGNRACDSTDVCYELAVATIYGWQGGDMEVTMTGR